LQHHYRQRLQQQHSLVRQIKHQLHQFEPKQALRNQTQYFYALKQRLFATKQRMIPQRAQWMLEQQHMLRLAYQHTEQIHLQHWQKRHEQLLAMNPKHVLKRGYAMTTDEQGNIITSAKKVKQGDQVAMHYHDGIVESTVDSVTEQP
jgi:exodeoxyribonuclease VII large subunit